MHTKHSWEGDALSSVTSTWWHEDGVHLAEPLFVCLLINNSVIFFTLLMIGLDTIKTESMAERNTAATPFSPWAKTQIFTYRYHLGGQNLIMFFMYTYAQCIIKAMIDLWTWQLSCGYHQFWLFYFLKNNIFIFFSDLQFISKIKHSSIVVLMKCSCSNTRGYQFWLYVSVSWKKKLKLS